MHQQLLACGRAFEGAGGVGERDEALQMLMLITDQPGGAAASVVVLQDRSTEPYDAAQLPEPVRFAVAAEFEAQHGRPPSGEQETVRFFKQMMVSGASSSHGVAGPSLSEMPTEVQLAATNAFADAYGGAAAPSALAALQVLEVYVKDSTTVLRSEGLPPQLHEALLADAQRANAFGQNAALVLDALLQAAVPLPPDVSAAAAAAFAAERGHGPASGAEALGFLKDKLAEAPQAQRQAAALLAPLQHVAPEAANAFGGPATLDVAPPQRLAPLFGAAQGFALQEGGVVSAAERDMLTTTKGAADSATSVERLLAGAILRQQEAELPAGPQGKGTLANSVLLPPAVALAVRNEFANRFDDSQLQSEGEITRFAKSIASDWDHHDARHTSGLSEDGSGSCGGSRKSASKFAALRALRGGLRGLSGAQPTIPGPLKRMPTGFALAAAFDTVKADAYAADGETERVSVGKRVGKAAIESTYSAQGARRRSVLTAQRSARQVAVRLSEFGAVATLHGLGASFHLGVRPAVKFALTLEGRVEDFDEAAVKAWLLQEMGGGPGGRHPELTTDDVTLEIRRGSVIVIATVRTRSAAAASAASAALTTLLANRVKATAAFQMPVQSIEQLPTLVSEPAHAGGAATEGAPQQQPLSGAQLKQAIYEALSQEEALVTGAFADKADTDEPTSKALRRASYACGLSIPIILLCVVAAVFGGGTNAAAVPLALGGIAVVGLVAVAYYFLRKSHRSQAEAVSKRAALLFLQRVGSGKGFSAQADVEAPHRAAPDRGVLSPLAPEAPQTPGGARTTTAFAGSGFGTDGRVAPVSAYRAPPTPTGSGGLSNPAGLTPPRPTHLLDRKVSFDKQVGGLTDPEARMQARLGRFGAPATAASPSEGAAARLLPVPTIHGLLPVPHPPSMPRPPPTPSGRLLPPIRSPSPTKGLSAPGLP